MSAAPHPGPELVTTGSDIVYQNRWMTVREDQTLRDDGRTGIFGIVEKPDFALIVPYVDGGFYIVEQYRYPVRGRYWEFPQGSWEEKPDADPLELARGELAEETGIEAASLVRIGHLFEAYGYSNQGFHVILATELTQGEASIEDSEKGLISRWASEAEVWDLIESGAFKDAPSIAALALFGRHRGAVDRHRAVGL